MCPWEQHETRKIFKAEKFSLLHIRLEMSRWICHSVLRVKEELAVDIRTRRVVMVGVELDESVRTSHE